ncbi:MAG TPA: radical SAM protein [Polyangiaceae bacterium]|nr:radical SAM protein [Polyangiaceae bacterium]
MAGYAPSNEVDWLLAFPPLVSSNWGNYYPSLAVLDSVLHGMGVSARQVDLNEEFLDYLIEPSRLNRIEQSDGGRSRADASDVPQRAAAQLARRERHRIVNARGQHVSDGEWNGFELTVELSRPFHIDRPALAVAQALPLDPVAREYRSFFETSSLPDALSRTRRAVGISVPMGPQLGPALILARLVREVRPDLKIVLGGPTMTLMQPAVLSALLEAVPALDAVVRFEGEPALTALAGQLASGRWDPASVPGVVTRGRAVLPLRRAPAEVGRVPAARFDAELLGRLEEPRVGVLQARGCYWGKCAYCDFIELFSSTSRYVSRQPRTVFDELSRLATEEGIRRFWLITEALPPSQAQRIARGVIDAGLSIDWRSFAMVDDRFTTDVLAACRDSGCSSLTIGLETMSDRVLALVEKAADRAANLRFFDRVRAAGMRISVNLIPNLPSTTRAEAMESLGLLRDYADIFHTVAVFPYEATASSAVGRNPGRYGLKVWKGSGTGGQAQFSSNALVVEDPAMRSDELEEVLAAYRAFAREVRNASPRRTLNDQLERGRRAPRGLAFRSGSVAVLPDEQQTIVYDWSRDRAWWFPKEFEGCLQRLQDLDRPTRRADLANLLANGVPTARIPGTIEALLQQLHRAELLGAAASPGP